MHHFSLRCQWELHILYGAFRRRRPEATHRHPHATTLDGLCGLPNPRGVDVCDVFTSQGLSSSAVRCAPPCGENLSPPESIRLQQPMREIGVAGNGPRARLGAPVTVITRTYISEGHTASPINERWRQCGRSPTVGEPPPPPKHGWPYTRHRKRMLNSKWNTNSTPSTAHSRIIWDPSPHDPVCRKLHAPWSVCKHQALSQEKQKKTYRGSYE